MRIRAFGIAYVALALLGCEREKAAEGGVPVLTYLRTIGSSLHVTDSVLLLPRDLAVRHDTLYVLDEAEPHVRIVSQTGELLATIGSRGGGPGEFQALSGIAVSPLGELAVADPRARRISVFKPTGELLADFPLSGRLGSIEFDSEGRLHVDHKGPFQTESQPGAPTVEILSQPGKSVGGYGSYDPQLHPIADALNNEVRFALAKDGGMWVLHSYRGFLELRSSTGWLRKTIQLPPPSGRSAGGPFVREVPGQEGAFMIVRLPVAGDVAVDEMGRVYVLAVQGGSAGVKKYSEIFVYSGAGELLGRQTLPKPAARLAIERRSVYALREPGSTPPGIDVYAIGEG